jgi:cobalamin biosynthesis Co2+ chelatase CbiK
MTTLEKFQEEANINFIHTPSHADIEIGELSTADGYELFYVTQDVQNLPFAEVYYYKPDFDTIMSEIKNAFPRNQTVNVMCFDIEDWFDEYDMLDYLESKMDEESFEAFTNEKE